MAGRRSDEKELATKSINIGGKHFSLDVKENRIGRFVKLREAGGKGEGKEASKILLPQGGFLAFHEALQKIASPAISKKAAPPAEEEGRPPVIHSEYVQVEFKKIHLDYIENARGRVLKISCVEEKGGRSTLMVPGKGIEELRAAFEAVLKESGDGMVIASVANLGGEGSGAGKPGEGDIDLGSKQLQIDSKRFFVDLKQNRIGRFLKITESLDNGTKQRIAIPAPDVSHFRDLITKFATMDIKDKVLPPGEDGTPPPLHSESMKIDQKVLFMDLKSNVRGRLLKISSVGNENRASIMLPGKSEQLETFAKALGDVLAMGDDAKGGVPSEETLAEATVQVQSKRFFVDLKSNLRGKFLKVTEVTSGKGGKGGKGGMRNKIIIPEEGIVRFYEAVHSIGSKNSRGDKGKGGEKGDAVASELVVCDGKTFYLDLIDNSRGRVMKVSQLVSDERVSIMLPAVGLEDFGAALEEVLREGGELVAHASMEASDGAAPGKPGEGNVELASKLVPIGGKRFFLDLKENEVGRFVQVTEVGQGGQRTKMSLPISAITHFRDCIGNFADMDTSALGKKAYTDKEGRPAALRSEVLKLDAGSKGKGGRGKDGEKAAKTGKEIYFDLNSNGRGCVLKIAMRDDRGRTTLMIPSTGLGRLRDVLTNC